MWETLGHNKTIAYEPWPTYDESKLADGDITYAVSVNGKLRDKIVMPLNTDTKVVEAKALESEKIKNYTDGHQIVKIIVIPNKIVNIVIK